jgi:hypothetical protein
MRVTDKHVFFWGEWPSNWFPCLFNVKIDGSNYTFYNSEQYFMYIKAKTFGDEEMALKILLEGKNPKKAKTFGRMVKNYDDKVWDEKRYQVMVDACYHKFKNNEELKANLLNDELKGKHFVEASPIDGIWGIKCGETEALDDKSNWNGLNLLGKALDEVREKLLKENG